ncbi:hypothetical protein [Ekhidna sp.]|uniref:hypothetical protein n=1 Tax=Ekhidna sp. TaxID=2608089 RepID=UPI003B504977
MSYNITLKVNDRLWFFQERSQNIMWCDYSKSGEDQMISLFNQAFDISKTAGSSVKILANFKSTPRSSKLTRQMRESGKWFNKEGIDVKIAVIGVDSVFTRVVINTTMTISRIKSLKLFESKDDALTWLSA